MKFSFGSDPEFMVVRNGTYKSAIGVIQGHTENRIRIRGHEFYYDNVLAECAIKPSYSKEEAVSNFRECLQLYAEMAHPFQLVPQAAQNYDRSELQHADAKKVNCDPEYCPYIMDMASSPVEEILHGTLRTCGGHIHLGEEGLKGNKGILAMYMMDLFVGIPSLWMDKDPTSSARRSMYGAAGRYRVKDYGMEYRSLSNFWLQNPRLVEFMYNISEFVTDFVLSGRADEHWRFDMEVFKKCSRVSEAWSCLTYDVDAVRQGIKTGDKTLVQSHYEMAQRLMPDNLRQEMLQLINMPTDTSPRAFYAEWGIRV